MKSYHYLIVGGGMTGDAAVRGIRELDPAASIGVLSAETHPPYDRPPLSKKLWTGKPVDSIWRGTEQAGVDLVLGTRVLGGDTAAKTLTDDQGNVYGYDKLLLATGGAPRRLAGAPDGVIYFRTLDDYQQLRALAERKSDFIVIGGGFIGSEIAAALAGSGCKTTIRHPDLGGAR
jgi:NADPH-dependent 2,4-dienoyl-CoA reductase/sulfur reductase-like enzyme